MLHAVAPDRVDQSQASAGGTHAEKKANAMLAISLARRLGCVVYVLWDDIVEANPKALLVLVTAIMAHDLHLHADKSHRHLLRHSMHTLARYDMENVISSSWQGQLRRTIAPCLRGPSAALRNA